jgi:hypothetical protein
MALLSEINRQKIKMYEHEFIILKNKYNQLLEDYNESLHEIKSLKKELDFFHRETRRHKYDWESMFYTNNNNINGYAFEIEKIEERQRSKSL